jgi:diguanylate cyclase (GGDEF)-like protein
MTKQTSLCMLKVDVDDFKAYNDALGQPQGDECLKRIAQTLREGLRQKGDQVSRFGREEFAILLPETAIGLANSIAERLRQRIEHLQLAHPASRAGPHVTVCIGVSGFVPSPEQSPHDLISQSDLAVYVAKDAGRNRVMYYDPERNEVAVPISA